MTTATPIADYGLIGNLHTAALICKNGSLDFLSYPRFDSPTLFTKILDTEKGGSWSITPKEVVALHTSQQYERDSAILVTRYMHAGGIVELTDFMPPVHKVSHCQIVRVVRALVGKTDLYFSFNARYPYGSEAVALVKNKDSNVLKLDLPLTKAVLLGVTKPDLNKKTPELEFTFTLNAALGADEPQMQVFILQSENCEMPSEGDVTGFGESLLTYTRDFWKNWVAKIKYHGPYSEVIRRSAITLKLCTSAEFGSSVAAPTFGLPEEIGGERNWDYRYAWIRDSAFTMYAMLRLGLTEEARDFMSWIEKRCNELDDAADLSLMYRVDGTCDLEEYTVDLAGYRDSKPVRVGNGAQGQRQLDIYGELIDTIYLYDGHGNEISYAFWIEVCEIINYVCKAWREPDHGMWESRGEKQQYTMSKVMAWVAIDRGIRIAEHRGFPAPHDKWLHERDELYRSIYEEHFDDKLQSWTQYPGSGEVDGSLLLMPLIRFVAPQEPNWQKTLDQIEKDLVEDCLVKRYLPKDGKADGLQGDEGYFTMCSCWYIEVLAKGGRVEEAQNHLNKLLGYANHLGLYSEELAINGLQLGNFPQAFTHLGLISAILQIAERLGTESGKVKAFG